MINDKDLSLFKERKVKARDLFTIRLVDKNTCYEFVKRYHYLGNAKLPFCAYSFGMYYNGEYGEEMVGCSTFSNPQGVFTLKSWFNLDNQCQQVLELTRLCVLPCLNGTNATSFLLGNSIKLLKKYGIKAVITLADASRHVGSIYQVCNFKYFGLTQNNKDFYSIDGIKNPRGKVHDKHGVHVGRARKHRYAYILDKNLECLYEEKPYPKTSEKYTPDCCHGTKKVYDPRFNEWFTCPVCCGYIQLLGVTNSRRIPIQNNKQYNDYGQLSLF